MNTRIIFTKLFIAIAFGALGTTSAFWPTRTASAAVAPDLPPNHYPKTISVGGTLRRYILYVPPAYDGHKKLPLVFVLHGFGGSASSMIGTTGFSDKAEAEGFFVAYLAGMTVGPASPFYSCGCPDDPAGWNTGLTPDLDITVDDVAFVRELATQLEDNLQVDARRVYVAGFSDGAFMTHRLGAELPNLLAGIAVVEGTIGLRQPPGPFLFIPPATGSIPVIIFHGLADENIPYYGGESTAGAGPHEVTSVADAVNFWREANRCQGGSTTVTSPGGNVITTSYDGCFANSDVILNTVVNGEHTWPHATTNEISATDAIWEFFAKHSLTAP